MTLTISHPFCKNCGAPHAAQYCSHCLDQNRVRELIEKWRARKKELYLPNQYEYNGYATACGDHADELEAALAAERPSNHVGVQRAVTGED